MGFALVASDQPIAGTCAPRPLQRRFFAGISYESASNNRSRRKKSEAFTPRGDAGAGGISLNRAASRYQRGSRETTRAPRLALPRFILADGHGRHQADGPPVSVIAITEFCSSTSMNSRKAPASGWRACVPSFAATHARS